MNTKDVSPILTALGWSIQTDEVGDKVAYYKLPDRKIQIIYGIKTLSDSQWMYTMESLSTDAFSKACYLICENMGDFAPLVIPWNSRKVRAPRISETHVRQASAEVISWAKEQNLNAALQEKAALPTTAPGTGPVLHLAALAVLSDVDRLEYYQSRFVAGDRLGFVPYITKEYIDRAVAQAKRMR